MNLKDKQVMVVDNGLFVEIAIRLARDFGKVYYCCPSWIDAFPKLNKPMIGHGYTEIEVVLDVFGEHYNDIDLFVFPDVYFGEMQLKLEAEGKLVWGARMGEELELDREAMKEHMAKLELPVGPWKHVQGMDALREFLRENKDQWVKVSRWRGLFETFLAKDYRSIEPKLDEIEYGLGAFKDIVDFCCETNLKDKVEIGADSYTVDGQYPSRFLSGIEIKDEGYVGVFKEAKDFPKEMTDWDADLSGTLAGYGYRGFYSTEIRVGEDHVPYMIDFCARAGSPPSELYQEFYLNFSDIIWQGANGIMVDPEPAAKYGAELLIHSQWADKNWQPLYIPDEIRQYVKLRSATKIKGRDYVIPQTSGLPEIGAVIGFGDTLDAALKMALDIGEQVVGFEVKLPVKAFDEAHEEIENLKQYGIEMF